MSPPPATPTPRSSCPSLLDAFLKITLGGSFALLAFLVRQKFLKRKVQLPSFHLGMNHQVSSNRVGSMLQLTSLLGNLSFRLPSWFQSVSNVLSAFALPISFSLYLFKRLRESRALAPSAGHTTRQQRRNNKVGASRGCFDE